MQITGSGTNVAINRVRFNKGRDNNNGGALRINSGNSVALTSCIFSGNTTIVSDAWGGAIFTQGTLTATACTFYNNSTYQGGAIYVQNGVTTLTGNVFYGNTASNNGHTVYRSSGRVTSGGYNVWDKDSYNFTFDTTGDEQYPTGEMFDITTFLPTAPVLFRVPSSMSGDRKSTRLNSSH